MTGCEAEKQSNPRRPGDRTLTQDVQRWPTPVANDDNKTPEAHLAMKARMGGGRKTITSLNVLTQQWPTPNTCDRGPETREAKAERGSGGADLQTLAKNWPTPGANDHKGTAKLGQRRGQLDEAAEQKWNTPSAATAMAGSVCRGNERSGELLLAGQAESLCSLQDPATSTPGKASSQSGPSSPRRLNPAFVFWLMGWPVATLSDSPATAFALWRRRMRSELFHLS